MPGSEVLVLIANENTATLCANSEGETRLLRSIERVPSRGQSPLDVLAASLSDCHAFACELMMVLGRSLGDLSYDGVIIFADMPMMTELRTVQTKLVSRLLMAQIVGTSSDHSEFYGHGRANADFSREGALQ